MRLSYCCRIRVIEEKLKNERKYILFRDDKMEEESTIDDVKTLLDWVYSSELSWIVLTLACFVGLIELLPEIKHYGSSVTDTALTYLLAFVALALVGSFIFCANTFVRRANAALFLEQKLPKTMRERGPRTITLIHKVMYEIDKEGRFVSLKRGPILVGSIVFAVIWIAIIVLKII